jgi:hypothetical protein
MALAKKIEDATTANEAAVNRRVVGLEVVTVHREPFVRVVPSSHKPAAMNATTPNQGWMSSSSGINTTLSCSLGFVRAISATKFSVVLGLYGICGTLAGI